MRLFALFLLLLSTAAGLFIVFRPLPEDARYAGSPACGTCHGDIYAGWKDSLHNRMMRPVERPGVVVADIGEENPDLLFEPEEAVWAIGGKWEQQFMGHDGEGETLLPGAWLVAHGRWKRTGWDGWRTPDPLRRCHGCHTVGLDVETGEFVEPNIGCESCHGPGSWHRWTSGLGQIHVSADAQVCGQCHTRGRSTDGEHHFPVGYRPGRNLEAYFEPLPPSPGQTSSSWWGNGSERRRHQQYAAWERGGHADSLRSLREGYDGRYGEVDADCLGCHSGDAILSGGRIGVEEAEHGITCSVCHEVHAALDEPRLTCGECHTQGAFYHEPERNLAHVPCPEEAQVPCTGCHMPLVVRNGGGFTMRSHAPGVVQPMDAATFEMPSGCANGGCHVNETAQQLQAVFTQHYGSRPEQVASREE